MREPAFCLQCDDGTLLEYRTKDVRIAIDDLSVIVPQVLGWHCPVCGEIEFIDKESSRRYSEALDSLRLAANKKRAESLRAMRKKLGLKLASCSAAE